MLLLKKKSLKVISIFTWVVFVIAILIFSNKEEFFSLVWRMKYPNSVNWNGIYIDLPKNFVYKFSKNENSLRIYDFKTVKGGILNIQVKDIKNKLSKDILEEYKADSGIAIYDYQEINFKGYKSFSINLKSYSLNNELRLIYVFPKNILIGLIGKERESFKQFDPVLERLVFVEENNKKF